MPDVAKRKLNLKLVGATSRDGGETPPSALMRPGNETARYQWVTKELADEWLRKNKINRKKRDHLCETYARNMRNDQWYATGAAIEFCEFEGDVEGILVNGQHRLTAISKTGIPIWSNVVRGLSYEARLYMDMGFNRTNADDLGYDGTTHQTYAHAAAARLVFAAKHGLRFMSQRVSRPELIDICRRHPQLDESVRLAYRGPKGIRPQILAGIHYVAKHVIGAEEKANAFVALFVDGEQRFPSLEAARKFREQAITIRGAKAEISRPAELKAAVIVWNACLLDKQPKDIWGKGGEEVKFEQLDPKRI